MTRRERSENPLDHLIESFADGSRERPEDSESLARVRDKFLEQMRHWNAVPRSSKERRLVLAGWFLRTDDLPLMLALLADYFGDESDFDPSAVDQDESRRMVDEQMTDIEARVAAILAEKDHHQETT